MPRRKHPSSDAPTPTPAPESAPSLSELLEDLGKYKALLPLSVEQGDRRYVCKSTAGVQANIVARLTVSSPRFEESFRSALIDLQDANLDAIFVDGVCITLGK